MYKTFAVLTVNINKIRIIFMKNTFLLSGGLILWAGKSDCVFQWGLCACVVDKAYKSKNTNLTEHRVPRRGNDVTVAT